MTLESLQVRLESELASLRESMNLRFAAIEQARQLQAVEYQRRLELLNGEAKRLLDMQATYVPRELWDVKREELMTSVRQLEAYRNNQVGRQTMLSMFVAAATSIIVTVIAGGILMMLK